MQIYIGDFGIKWKVNRLKTSKVTSADITRPNVIGTFEGKCADASIENSNQMTLGPELWDVLFNSEEYKTALENRHYIGFLGHPEDPGCMDYKDACIIMTECHRDDDGQVYGTFDLIDTPVGRVVKSFQDAGVNFGISVRGAGDVDSNGIVDPDTFIFRGFDLVTFPAYSDAIPSFTEIAASKDLNKQVKYKAVCAAIEHNLHDIDSVKAIETLQSQFSITSSQYKTLETRKATILCDTKTLDISKQQLDGITALYLDAIKANKQLQTQLKSVKHTLNYDLHKAQRQLYAMKRITSSQLTDARTSIDKLYKMHNEDIKANKQLQSQLKSIKGSNLLYKQQMDTHKQANEDKDNLIADLQAQLDETVNNSKQMQQAASNRDSKIDNLKSEIASATKLLEEYQQAYADLYASALGVHLDAVPVCASTTVGELKSLIKGNAVTASSIQRRDPEFVDVTTSDDTLVTL